MRIYLKTAQQVGDISYPSAGFYNNVPDELAREWLASGAALPASEKNEIVNPFATVAPSALEVESTPTSVDGGVLKKRSRGDV